MLFYRYGMKWGKNHCIGFFKACKEVFQLFLLRLLCFHSNQAKFHEVKEALARLKKNKIHIKDKMRMPYFSHLLDECLSHI